MALCNAFGELSLEETQQEIKQLLVENHNDSDLLLASILRELKMMNMHLSHLTDQRILEDDIL